MCKQQRHDKTKITKGENEKMKETKNKKILLGLLAAVAVIVVLIGAYFIFAPKAVKGAKAIVIEVVDDAQESTVYKVNTDAEFLREAMQEAEGLTFSGTESEYGLMLDTINGIVADYFVNGAYWSVLVNGEYGNYGIDTQPLADGDTYSLVYTAE